MEGSSYAREAAAPRSGGSARGRRLLVPLRIASIRLRAHAGRNLVVAVGIAVGAAVLAMTAVGAVAVQDRAVQRALGALQPSDRAVQAVWSGVPGAVESLASAARPARAHRARAGARTGRRSPSRCSARRRGAARS